MKRAFLVGLFVVVAACVVSQPQQGTKVPAHPANPPGGGGGGDLYGGGSYGGGSYGGGGGALADGATCSSALDCASGVCEGEGCGTGVCASAERICTRDLQTYCGCDGTEFKASGSCPGRIYKSRGSCGGAAAAKPDGSACDSAGECASGVCEGQGCGTGQGVCAPKSRPCTRDLQTYCGCDGTEFKSSGSCPGQRFSKKGPC